MQQHFSCLSISISCCLTFLVALSHLASTASLVQPTKIPNSTAQASAKPVCVHDSNWLGTHYGHSDCRGAVNNFIASEVQTHRRQAYEFLAQNAQPIHDLPVVKTPRRYTSGACSLVIAMISSPSFPTGTLPYLPPARYYPADVSNFGEITRVAEEIVHACVGIAVEPPEQCAGYIRSGERESIGVFIWGTFSQINHAVGPGVNEIVANGTVSVSGNGTVVGEEFLSGPMESGTWSETS